MALALTFTDKRLLLQRRWLPFEKGLFSPWERAQLACAQGNPEDQRVNVPNSTPQPEVNKDLRYKFLRFFRTSLEYFRSCSLGLLKCPTRLELQLSRVVTRLTTHPVMASVLSLAHFPLPCFPDSPPHKLLGF